jgi:hypothetical protein
MKKKDTEKKVKMHLSNQSKASELLECELCSKPIKSVEYEERQICKKCWQKKVCSKCGNPHRLLTFSPYYMWQIQKCICGHEKRTFYLHKHVYYSLIYHGNALWTKIKRAIFKSLSKRCDWCGKKTELFSLQLPNYETDQELKIHLCYECADTCFCLNCGAFLGGVDSWEFDHICPVCGADYHWDHEYDPHEDMYLEQKYYTETKESTNDKN